MGTQIRINKKPYQTVDAVVTERFPQWPEQFRTSGEQTHANHAPFPYWVPNTYNKGIGRDVYKAGEGSYDFATCTAIWGNITLPLRVKTCGLSDSNPTAVVKGFADSKGNTFSVWLDSAHAFSATWDTTNKQWTVGGDILASGCVGVYGVIRHEGNLFAVADDAGTLHTYKSTDAGVTWVANTDTSLSGIGPAILVSVVDGASSDLYITTWTAATSTITVYKSTDDAANWSLLCSIYSKEGPKGLVWFEYLIDATSDSYPILRTYEGSWVCKAVPLKFLDTGQVGDAADAQGLCIWQELLAIPTGKDLILRSKDSINTPSGITQMDGFPSDYLGYTTALLAARYHLIAAIQGTYTGIYRYDGEGWHSIFVDSTAGRVIRHLHASASSTIPTLFFSLGAGLHRYIENYHDNPLEITTTEYEEFGTFDLPSFSGELAETQIIVYSIHAYTKNLQEGAEEIDILYKLDDRTNFTYLGTLTDITKVLSFPRGGVACNRIQLRAKLKRGSTYTETPVLYYLALEFQQLLDVLIISTFTIDCGKTATLYDRRNVVEELRTIQKGSGLIEYQTKSLSAPVTMYVENLRITEDDINATASFTTIEV
uniref:Putative structural protein n=1 Tax=viral metagenome TaxID=1070528 RepID=A0A6M3IK80_9ZZZZ